MKSNNDVNSKKKLSFLKSQDWQTVLIGSILITAVSLGLIAIPLLPQRWGTPSSPSILSAFPQGTIGGILIAGLISLIVFSISAYLTNKDGLKKFIRGFSIIYLLSTVATLLGNYSPWRHYGINNVIWALIIGIIISNVFKLPDFIKSAVRTELYIKTGLVLLGSSILFDRMLSLGILGLGVAWIVTPLVIIIMYWFSQKVLKMHSSKELAVTIASATSVCGVSAAIATGTAVRAKKEEITLAISITLIFTAIMMIGMPFLVIYLDIGPYVGGAWIGGTIDATGAVVAASSVIGQESMEIASVIKMIQNILIGIVAFSSALIWVAFDGKRTEREKSSNNNKKPGVGLIEIWRRLPKFIIGFIGASLVFSFLLKDNTVSSTLPIINEYREIFFTLAFVSIGLETNFKGLGKSMKIGKPVILYIVGQSINVILTLIAAWIFFSGTFFTLPF